MKTFNWVLSGVAVCECCPHTRVDSRMELMSLSHIHTRTNTHTSLGELSRVTRARFDFIPSLPPRLSLGPSHKQSPGSKSRYEISFAGCWQVPHVYSPACLPCSLYISICECVRTELSHTGEFIDQRSRPDEQVPAAHKVASCMSQMCPLTYSSSHLSYTHTRACVCIGYLWTHTNTSPKSLVIISLCRRQGHKCLVLLAWQRLIRAGVKVESDVLLWYGTHTHIHPTHTPT